MENKIKTVITTLNRIKNEFLCKIEKLWQSKDENYSEMQLAGICLFVLSISCFIFAHFSNNEWELLNNIAKYSANYMGFLVMLTAICFLILYWYIYNDNTKIKKYFMFFIPIIIIVIIIAIMIIPLIPILILIQKSLDYRAKKMDNIISFFVILCIAIFVIMLLLNPNLYLASSVSEFLENKLKLKHNLNLDTSPMFIFIFITLNKMEIDIVSSSIIYFKKKTSNKNMLLRLKKIKESSDTNISISNLDTENHKQEESDEFRKLKDELNEKIIYDIKYLKNTFRKCELAILIILFILAMFKVFPCDALKIFEPYQSDIINVLTLYTLVMLYVDKRKEWK